MFGVVKVDLVVVVVVGGVRWGRSVVVDDHHNKTYRQRYERLVIISPLQWIEYFLSSLND